MIIIRLGNFKAEGYASRHLIECLSGRELPLAGVSKIPYVRGGEILENFKEILPFDDIYYLGRKDHVVQSLARVSPRAAAEIEEIYGQLEYIPFKKESCRIIEGLPENVRPKPL